MIGTILAVGFLNFNKYRNTPKDVAQIIYGNLLRERSQAMANTEARRLIMKANGALVMEEALNCKSAPTSWQNQKTISFQNVRSDFSLDTFTIVPPTPADPTLFIGDRLVVCFTSRGTAVIPQSATSGWVRVFNTKYRFVVETALGGGVRIYGE